MSRKHHELLEGAGGVGVGVKAVWDTGSSLYDSYELAAVHRLLDDKRLLALRDEPLPPVPPGETRGRGKSRQLVVPVVSRVHRRKATLRALFRAVATWAARPRQAPLACACAAGMVHDQGGAAVEPDLPSHGQL